MRVALMRHGFAGTSIPDDPKADDARPLQPEGRAAAAAMAKWMRDEDLIPDAILAGPAVRTMETARIVGDILGVKVKKEPLLYAHGPGTVVLQRLADDGAKRQLLVTHDDVIETILHSLAEGQHADKVAMGEVRVFDFSRDDLDYEERERCLPSDLGLEDIYDHRAIVVHEE